MPNELRSLAEARLTLSENRDLAELTKKDVLELVHELEVHQIELEIQNEELRHAEAVIEESRQKYTDLYDFAPVGYFTLDEKGVILETNLAFSLQVHIERSRLVGKPLVIAIAGDNYDVFFRHLSLVFKQKKRTSCRVRMRKRGGGSFYALLDMIYAENAAGEFTCRASVTDIDDLVQTEEALQSARAELEKKVEERTAELKKAMMAADSANRAKSEFLANLSHEIRSPMQTILGMSELLCEAKMTTEQKEYVAILRKAGENFFTLINDMLNLSKIESCTFELNEAPFDLNSTVENMMKGFLGKVGENGVTLSYHMDKNIPPLLRGDSLRLQQILLNLLRNALKFTKKGTVSLQVKLVNAGEENDKCLIYFSVQDTGIGIAEDRLESIWDDFSQIDGTLTREHGGAGLGLAISKKLTDRMGGDIRVKSRLGKGSTFYLTLPFQIVEESGLAEEEPEPLKPEDIPFTKVLIIEDSQDIRMLLGTFMKKIDCFCQMAENGVAGVEKFISGTFDIVFMDIQMPFMDGFEATRKIRCWERDNEKKTIPIIALTAHAFKDEIQQCFDAGCTNVLAKPVSRKIIYKTLYDYRTGRGADLSYKRERRCQFRMSEDERQRRPLPLK